MLDWSALAECEYLHNASSVPDSIRCLDGARVRLDGVVTRDSGHLPIVLEENFGGRPLWYMRDRMSNEGSYYVLVYLRTPELGLPVGHGKYSARGVFRIRERWISGKLEGTYALDDAVLEKL